MMKRKNGRFKKNKNLKMLRRSYSVILCTIMVLVCFSWIPGVCSEVFAEGEEEPHWERTGEGSHFDESFTYDMEVWHNTKYGEAGEVLDGDNINYTDAIKIDRSATGLEYQMKATVLKAYYDDTWWKENGSYKVVSASPGNYFSITGTITEIPKILKEGDLLEITGNLDSVQNYDYINPSYAGSLNEFFNVFIVYGDLEWNVPNYEGNAPLFSGGRLTESLSNNGNEKIKSDGGSLSAEIKPGIEDGEKMHIVVFMSYGNDGPFEKYHYKDFSGVFYSYDYTWVGEGEAAVPASDETTPGGDSSETKTTATTEATTEEPVHETVRTTADYKPGDDGGSPVNPVIIFGVSVGTAAVGAGAGAAAAAAGTTSAGSPSDSSNSQTNDGSTYKLHVYKDFGQTIRAGSRPKTIYAYVEKISGGSGFIDPGLTQGLAAFTNDRGITVRTGGIEKNMLRIDISADKNYDFKKFDVIIRLVGATGGTFTKVVTFYIAPPPEIIFMEYGGRRMENMLRLLSNKTTKQDIYIQLVNFVEKPEHIEIKMKDPRDEGIISTSVGKSRTDDRLFKIDIENRSCFDIGIFDNPPIEKEMTVRAYNSYGDDVTEDFILDFYPEGIFIGEKLPSDKHNDKEYLPIETSVGRIVEGTFQPQETYLNLDCAFLDKNGKVRLLYAYDEGAPVDRATRDALNIRWNNFKAEDQLSADLFSNTERFSIELSKKDNSLKNGEMIIAPKKALIMKSEDIYYLYTIEFYNDRYKLELPFRLRGELDMDDGVGKSKAELIKRLKHLAVTLQLNEIEDMGKLVGNLESCPKYSILPYAHVLYEEGLIYQNCKGNEYMKWSAYMGNCISTCSKVTYICDLTLSLIIVIKTGGAAWYAEPLAMGLKDIVFNNLIGEYTNSYVWDTPFRFDTQSMLETADKKIDDIVINFINGDSGMSLSLSKIVIAIVAAAAINVCKNTNANWEKYSGWELFKRVTSAVVGDMSIATLKAVLINKINKLLRLDSGRFKPLMDRVNSSEKIKSELSYKIANIDVGKVGKKVVRGWNRCLRDVTPENIAACKELNENMSQFLKEYICEKLVSDGVDLGVEVVGENAEQIQKNYAEAVKKYWNDIKDNNVSILDVAGTTVGIITIEQYLLYEILSSSAEMMYRAYQDKFDQENSTFELPDNIYLKRAEMEEIFTKCKLAAEQERYREMGQGLWAYLYDHF